MRGRSRGACDFHMRRSSARWLDDMKFPLTLAGGLRAGFADVVSSPVPEARVALARELTASEVWSGGEPDQGSNATETPSGIHHEREIQ